MTAPTIGLLVLAFVAGVLVRSVWEAVGRWRRARRFAGEWDEQPLADWEVDILREFDAEDERRLRATKADAWDEGARTQAAFPNGSALWLNPYRAPLTDELREYLARHHAVTERGDET